MELFTKTIQYGGETRGWNLKIPKNFCNTTKPLKLVVDIHGRGGTAWGMLTYSGFNELADEEGFMVAYPQGTQRFDPSVAQPTITTSFNAGYVKTMWANLQNVEIERKGCCDPAVTLDVDDVGFLRAMVDDITTEYGIDKHKSVYWTGTSNGCTMAQRMGIEASDIVTAISCTAHYLMKSLTEFTPLWRDKYRPVPIMEIHGTSDAIVGYGYPLGLDSNGYPLGAVGGIQPFANDGLQWNIASTPQFTSLSGQWYKRTGISASSNRETWASINGCTDYLSSNLPLQAPLEGSASTPLGGNTSICFAGPDPTFARLIETSTDCLAGSEVALVSLIGGGHTPPAVDVTRLMWGFMGRYPDNKEQPWIPENCEVL